MSRTEVGWQPDLRAATREVKTALRAQITASGRTVEDVFAVVEQRVQSAIDDIATARRR